MDERLDAAAAELGAGLPRAAGLGEELEAALHDAQASLQATREAVNADPLGLWSGGRVDTAAADLVREQVAGLTARIAELDRVRSQARRRIDGLTAAVAAARAARADAVTAWHRGRAADRGAAAAAARHRRTAAGQPGRARGGGPLARAGDRA